MRHHYINERGDHYAVGPNSHCKLVLLQVQDRGEQVRIPLTPEHARHVISLLEEALRKIEGHHPSENELWPDTAG